MALSVSTSPELSTLKFSDQGTLILSSSETKKGNSAINSSDIFQIIPTYALSNIRVSVDAYGGFWSRTYINASPDWSGGTPLYVSAISGQTGDLTKWQNSAGTTLARVASNGVMKANVGLVAENSTLANYTALQVNSTITNGTGVVVQGASGQTANLQEWQDSSGNKLAKITSSGGLIFGNGGSGAGITTIYFDQVTTSTNTPDGITWNFVTTNTKSAQILAVRTAASYATDLYFATANPADQNASEKMRIGSTGTVTINGFTSSNVGLIIKAAASQTANLQEWQNSAGTVLAGINYIGQISTVYGAYTGSASFGGVSWNGISNPAGVTTLPSLVVKSITSQTANLQEWQDSAGTVMAKVTSGGSFTSYNTNFFGRTFFLQDGSTNASTQASGAYFAASSANSAIYARTTSASIIPLVVQGTTSQTADLQQWQNSSSIALAKVDANGNFSAISKSFDIAHPTKENMRLRYASLEGPENGVYIRGTVESNIIELPEYWTGLVHEDSITVSLTAIGSAQNIYVEKIEDNKVYIGGELTKAFFTVYGERKDIDKLTVEY